MKHYCSECSHNPICRFSNAIANIHVVLRDRVTGLFPKAQDEDTFVNCSMGAMLIRLAEMCPQFRELTDAEKADLFGGEGDKET